MRCLVGILHASRQKSNKKLLTGKKARENSSDSMRKHKG